MKCPNCHSSKLKRLGSLLQCEDCYTTGSDDVFATLPRRQDDSEAGGCSQELQIDALKAVVWFHVIIIIVMWLVSLQN